MVVQICMSILIFHDYIFVLTLEQCSKWGGGGAQGDGALLFFFFFVYPNYIFSPERGDATFILIDVQNNFYVNFNLRQFENEFYDLYYQNYFHN
jgi:hypothetical protein